MANSPQKYPCHCCGYLTLSEPPCGFGPAPDAQSFEICKVCFWEDEMWEFDETAGGANRVPLSVARRNFKEFGATEERFKTLTRAPLPSEHPV